MRILAAFFFTLLLASCQKETGDAAGNEPLAAQTLTNVSYGSDPAQKMDVYLPAGRTDTTKLIVMVHGGAWVTGDKAEFTPYVSVLQQRLQGYAVANINYRLATAAANHFPVQEADMKAAVDFLVQKSGEYHLSQKIVLLGASAGAHMALLQAYKNTSPKIRAVVDFFGPTDIAALYNGLTNPADQIAFQLLVGGTPASSPTIYQQSSPINFVNAQTPPTILLHGDADDIVNISQSVSLKAKLQASGVVHQLVVYPGRGHEVWPMAIMNDAFDKIETFLKANVH